DLRIENVADDGHRCGSVCAARGSAVGGFPVAPHERVEFGVLALELVALDGSEFSERLALPLQRDIAARRGCAGVDVLGGSDAEPAAQVIHDPRRVLASGDSSVELLLIVLRLVRRQLALTATALQL